MHGFTNHLSVWRKTLPQMLLKNSKNSINKRYIHMNSAWCYPLGPAALGFGGQLPCWPGPACHKMRASCMSILALFRLTISYFCVMLLRFHPTFLSSAAVNSKSPIFHYNYKILFSISTFLSIISSLSTNNYSWHKT